MRTTSPTIRGPRTRSLTVLACLAAAWLATPTQADVRLASVFSDHMVLQRNQRLPVWGWADDGEDVTVQFQGESLKTKAQGGKWSVSLSPRRASGPSTLTVIGKNRVQFEDVLVGEVWIASGQSNMEWPLRLAFQPNDAIQNSANEQIRLLTVPKLKANQPVDDIKASWIACNPATISNFSAVAYFFARDLQKALKVPVGIIHTSWGGSPAEVWMKDQALASNPEYKKDILDSFDAQMKQYHDALQAFDARQAELKKEGKTSTDKPPGRPYWKPSELYNGMIAPLIPYAIKGAIWYQGESNAGRAWQYRTLFADMIRNWRTDWAQGPFTFLEVQLAPWDKNKKRTLEEITREPGPSDWAELREAQVLATHTLPNVGIAVITDIGDKDDIHPTRKEPVGARLALAARQIAYGERIVASGPTFDHLKVRGNQARIRFKNTGTGLELHGPKLTGFSIAGADGRFVWANATIETKDTVVLSSPSVPKPVHVRYGWADFPVLNLFNKEGLPASPFRTDSLPMITLPTEKK